MADTSGTPKYTTSLRLHNSRSLPIELYLEPWGEQYAMPPDVTFTATASGPEDDTLEVEIAEDHIRLYGWPGSIVEVAPGERMEPDEQYQAIKEAVLGELMEGLHDSHLHHDAWWETLLQVARSKKLVVIIGAGVSAEAGIPAGGAIIRDILQGADGSLVRGILEQAGGKAEEAGFFRVLALYKNVIGDEQFWKFLTGQLKYDKTNGMTIVSESYDLLAHFLHHERISALISLNFDTLLDKAIELETQSVDPTRVIQPVASLSEFAALIDEIRRRREGNVKPSIPNQKYLKPHGTMERTRTIRVTEEAIQRFEVEKRQILADYLQDATVVTLGWSLRDPDLLALLKNTRRPRHTPDVIAIWARASVREIPHYNGFRILPCGAAHFLKALASIMSVVHGEGEPPRLRQEDRSLAQRSVGTLRHTIRSAFFAVQDGAKEPLFHPTVAAQAALEIVILALKARGHFAPQVLFDCPRTASLARALLGSQEMHRLAHVLQRLCTEDAAVLARDVNERGEPVYWLNADLTQRPHTTADAILETIAQEAFHHFVANLSTWEGVSTGQSLSQGQQEKIIQYFMALTRSFDIDMDDNLRHYTYFTQPVLIRNRQQFKAITAKLFAKLAHAQARIYVSAYTGEWLINTDYIKSVQGSHGLHLIVDDFTAYKSSPHSQVASLRVQEIKDLYGSRITVRCMKDKIHNMTVLVDQNGTFQEGVYFRRESKTTQVSPVHLTDPGDLHILQSLWDAMSKEATPVQEFPSKVLTQH